LNLVAVDNFGQQKMKKTEFFNFHAQPDSIISKHQHGYIYITRDTAAEMFDRLVSDVDVNGSELNIFREYASHIKKKFDQGVVVKNLGDFPRKWNSVYLLNDTYYVYSPSDWMSNAGYYVSDSVIFITKSDPDDLFVILNHKKINKKLDEFRIVNYAGEKHNVQIRLVDAAYGIYVWTFAKNGNLLRYLMQDSRFVKRLPMIVADCGDSKCALEFAFDKPDFEKILDK
jgi:hypothetical protein